MVGGFDCYLMKVSMYLTLILFDFSNIIIIGRDRKENMKIIVNEIIIMRDIWLIGNIDLFPRNIDRKTFEVISRMRSFILSQNNY